MITDEHLASLQEGDVVEFTYKQQSGNYRWYLWVCRAVFLYRQQDEYADDLYISYRPLAGTSYIRTPHLVDFQVITPVADRTMRREDPGVRLPRRVPGAVDPPKLPGKESSARN